MFRGDTDRRFSMSAYPERQPLALWWMGIDADLRDSNVFAIELEGRAAPREAEHRDRLLETRSPMIDWVAERATLLEQPAGADAELESPVREQVDRRGLLRERQRVREDERHDGDPEPHAFGRRCGEREQGHRIDPRARRVPGRNTGVVVGIA